jgi:hypothetical protein
MLLLPMVLVSQLLKPNPKITASHMPITSLNRLRRSSLLAVVSLRPASQTRAASKTRSGPTPSQSPRRRKKTSLLDRVERPSVSASVSRSSSLRSTNVSLRLLSVVDVVDSAVAEAVVMDHPVAAEVNSVDVATEVVIEEIVEDAHAATEPLVALQETTLPVHPLTLATLRLSPALDHRVLAYSLHTIFNGADSSRYVRNDQRKWL